jgi:hypothetical protein
MNELPVREKLNMNSTLVRYFGEQGFQLDMVHLISHASGKNSPSALKPSDRLRPTDWMTAYAQQFIRLL